MCNKYNQLVAFLFSLRGPWNISRSDAGYTVFITLDNTCIDVEKHCSIATDKIIAHIHDRNELFLEPLSAMSGGLITGWIASGAAAPVATTDYDRPLSEVLASLM